MAGKPLVGQKNKQHLMRVRIRKTIFDRLQDLASEQTIQTGEHVTISDIVRVACVNYLVAYEGLRQLQNTMSAMQSQAANQFQPSGLETEIFIVAAPIPIR